MLDGLKVLVVDDEPDARELVAQILTECRADIRTAASAAEALGLLPAFRPDILVSDIGMPGCDGYQFMQAVRRLSGEQGGRTPAIALTAFCALGRQDHGDALRLPGAPRQARRSARADGHGGEPRRTGPSVAAREPGRTPARHGYDASPRAARAQQGIPGDQGERPRRPPRRPGQIHAVLGENGAGKSTLMKMIYGAVRPDAGEIRWNGDGRDPQPAGGAALGIAMVFQHFSLFDTPTAAENVWLGLGKSLAARRGRAPHHRGRTTYGLEVDPLRPVHTLSVGERQRSRSCAR
jgi:CheY-like chemotaxis protein